MPRLVLQLVFSLSFCNSTIFLKRDERKKKGIVGLLGAP